MTQSHKNYLTLNTYRRLKYSVMIKMREKQQDKISER